MAPSFGNKTPRGPVGLDLDGGYVAAVHMTDGRIRTAASEALPPDLIRDGEVVDPDGLSDSLKTFTRSHSLPKRVRLGVSNQQIAVRQLDLPRIEDGRDLDAAVRFQAAEAIAMPIEEVVLDHLVIGESVAPDGTPRVRVLLVAARESMVSQFVDAVRGAGMKPEGVDLDAFALVRTLARENGGPGPSSESEAEETARVFCHLGGITNLAIALGSKCLFTRPLSTRWEGEQSEVVRSLAEEIRLSIDYHMGQPEARPVGDAVLSGPGSTRENLADEVGQLIHLPVSVADPLGGMERDGLPEDEDPHRHTVALGLAMGAAA